MALRMIHWLVARVGSKNVEISDASLRILKSYSYSVHKAESVTPPCQAWDNERHEEEDSEAER